MTSQSFGRRRFVIHWAAVELALISMVWLVSCTSSANGPLPESCASCEGARDAGAVERPAAKDGASPTNAPPKGDAGAAGDSGAPDPTTLFLDPTFGSAGLVTTAIRNGTQYPLGIVRQSDGRSVVVGTDSSSAMFVARFTAAGALDPSFGSGGKVLVPSGGPRPVRGCFAVQADGKVLLGQGTDVSRRIARVTVDGRLDATFGSNGVAPVSVSPRGISVTPDGMILVVGPEAIVRLTASGAPDAMFSLTGFVSAVDEVLGVAVDPTGRILLPVAASALRIWRLRPWGAIDVRWGTDGVVDTGLSPIEDFTNGSRTVPLGVQPDGKVIVGGAEGSLHRYGTEGKLDTAFGTNGAIPSRGPVASASLSIGGDGRLTLTTTTSVSRYSAAGSLESTFATDKLQGGFWARAAVSAPDASVLVAGISGSARAPTVAVAHFLSTGALDTSFGVSGAGSYLPPTSHDEVHDLALQKDGKIVACGPSSASSGRSGWAVTRYASDGTLDPTFGSAGRLVSDPGNESGDVACAMVIDGDGKIVVIGNSAGGSRWFAARYTSAGVLDTSFGSAGEIRLGAATCHAATLDTAGRIVVVGTTTTAYQRFFVSRLTANGSLDPTFNGTGSVATDLGNGGTGSGIALAVTVQPDGKIVAAGNAKPGLGGYWQGGPTVVRYTEAGALDTTFDRRRLAASLGAASVHAVAVQSDGKLIVTGSVGAESSTTKEFWSEAAAQLFVARLESDGTVDERFGGVPGRPGVVKHDLGAISPVGQAIRLLPDGRIWVAGEVHDRQTKRGFLLRLTSDGVPDRTFMTNGYGFVPQGIGGPSGIRAIVQQTDGKLVAGGDFFVQDTATDFGLFRLP